MGVIVAAAVPVLVRVFMRMVMPATVPVLVMMFVGVFVVMLMFVGVVMMMIMVMRVVMVFVRMFVVMPVMMLMFERLALFAEKTFGMQTAAGAGNGGFAHVRLRFALMSSGQAGPSRRCRAQR